jgi:hypothetical protein
MSHRQRLADWVDSELGHDRTLQQFAEILNKKSEAYGITISSSTLLNWKNDRHSKSGISQLGKQAIACYRGWTALQVHQWLEEGIEPTDIQLPLLTDPNINAIAAQFDEIAKWANDFDRALRLLPHVSNLLGAIVERIAKEDGSILPLRSFLAKKFSEHGKSLFKDADVKQFFENIPKERFNNLYRWAMGEQVKLKTPDLQLIHVLLKRNFKEDIPVEVLASLDRASVKNPKV